MSFYHFQFGCAVSSFTIFYSNYYKTGCFFPILLFCWFYRSPQTLHTCVLTYTRIQLVQHLNLLFKKNKWIKNDNYEFECMLCAVQTSKTSTNKKQKEKSFFFLRLLQCRKKQKSETRAAIAIAGSHVKFMLLYVFRQCSVTAFLSLFLQFGKKRIFFLL